MPTMRCFFWCISNIIYVTLFLSVCVENCLISGAQSTPHFLASTGIADITGPITGLKMFGYAKADQFASGIHTRLYSRAFIFATNATKDNNDANENELGEDDREINNRLVYVVADIAMCGSVLKRKVIEKLSEQFGPNMYRNDNVMITVTHTHSGPEGYMQRTLYTFPSMGINEGSFNAVSQGIANSIIRAHRNGLRKSRIFVGKTNLIDASINRSPSAYDANPATERSRYEHNVDTAFTQLSIFGFNEDEGKFEPIGAISWFAVHGTSLDNSNHLVSSDNKGIASIIMENEVNSEETLIGKGPFVAGFAISNAGDVSPNTRGSFCQTSGELCDEMHSTCEGRVQNCRGSGPGGDMFESAIIIAGKQANASLSLMRDAQDLLEMDGRKSQTTEEITDDFISLKTAHKYMDMSKLSMFTSNGTMGRTCPPALGVSFGAGTTDGPGIMDFVQGSRSISHFWKTVSEILISSSSSNMESCHWPKPILLNLAKMDKPYPWFIRHVEVQAFKIGNFFVVGLPAEITTMAGRRFKDALLHMIRHTSKRNESSGMGTDLVISGLSNTYTHYITTLQEYGVQRYEGASTIYGPHTLEAYIAIFTSLISKGMLEVESDKRTVRQLRGSLPTKWVERRRSSRKVRTEIIPTYASMYDVPSFDRKFGECIESKKTLKVYRPGDVLRRKFVASSLHSNLMTDDTYVLIERQINGTYWQVAYTDAHWNTKLHWYSPTLFGSKRVIISWQITQDVLPGVYRIGHQAHRKHMSGTSHYLGYCKPFAVNLNPLMSRRRTYYHSSYHNSIR